MKTGPVSLLRQGPSDGGCPLIVFYWFVVPLPCCVEGVAGSEAGGCGAGAAGSGGATCGVAGSLLCVVFVPAGAVTGPGLLNITAIKMAMTATMPRMISPLINPSGELDLEVYEVLGRGGGMVASSAVSMRSS